MSFNLIIGRIPNDRYEFARNDGINSPLQLTVGTNDTELTSVDVVLPNGFFVEYRASHFTPKANNFEGLKKYCPDSSASSQLIFVYGDANGESSVGDKYLRFPKYPETEALK